MLDLENTMQVAFESPDQPEVIQLIAGLDAYQDMLYPPESRQSLDLASVFMQKQIEVWPLRQVDVQRQALNPSNPSDEARRPAPHSRALA